MKGKKKQYPDVDSKQIYEKYAELVYKFLISLCNDHTLAEDLTQETFYQAMKSLSRYDGSCKVSTWLCEIAKRLWYKELRKRRIQTVELLEETVKMEQPGPEEEYMKKDEKRRLYEQVKYLEEQEREVVLLHIVGGFCFREIGEMLGKTENWARVTFYRTKQKLIKVLGEK